MKAIFARMFVSRDAVDLVLRALPALVEGTRSEPGNHTFMAHQSKDDPTIFGFYEQFTDEAAHVAHSDMPHVREILDIQAKHGVRSIEVVVWDLKEPASN
ncbi:putative quinol monooxygenase [Inquilinus sp. OTU3971]|uniref:putative quinol monooxygenase n=1 Tax=Inquilinus sp. OTU3971 TaxID=3043855 RepID=UPI00313C2590